MSFFGVNVNPFSTPVGQRIEKATDGNLASENWALNMEICDIVNETEDGPRDAIKAIKRRLNQAANRNYTVVMYALVVLETCVKNCGKRFHTLACSRDFVQELVKTIGPKNEPPTVVQEKVLSLIRTWADTFRHQPHAQGVCQVYQELKAKGIQFPITDLDAMAPIITPERSVPETEVQPCVLPPTANVVGPTAQIAPGGQLNQEDMSGAEIVPASVQPAPLPETLVAKLRSELDVVQGNMRVMAEMLAHFTSPEQADRQPEAADLELLQQLYATCKSMQERVVELISRLVDDEMTAELLRINDELNNLFLRYSRYTKSNVGQEASAIIARTIGQPVAQTPTGTPSKRATAGDPDSLIDLSDGAAPLAAQISELGITEAGTDAPSGQRKEPDSDEFDMFAQSRNATYETTKNSGSKYEDNMEPASEGVGLSTAILNRGKASGSAVPASTTNPNRESDFNEMAAWLSNHMPATENRGDADSVSWSEFERFLAERAAAAEALPTLPATTPAATSSSQSTEPPTTNIQRQINKDQDKSTFAL